MDATASTSYFPDYDLTDYCKNNSSWTLAAFNMFLTLLGLICGLFLILLIFKNQALKGDKFLLLNNFLCSAIFLLLVTGFVYTEEAINPFWQVGHFFCKIFQFMKTALTTSSICLLCALANQQLNRYGQRLVTGSNSTHKRLLKTVCVIWCFAGIYSIPELVFGEVVSYDPDEVCSICGDSQSSFFARFYSYITSFVLEFTLLFTYLPCTVIATGVYFVKFQRTTRGVTTGEVLDARDIDFPKHFGMIVALTIVFIIGFFPLVSLKLFHVIEDLAQTGRFGSFWIHMDTISTSLLILPPALTPLLIMLFSWVHRDVILQSITNLTVNIQGYSEGGNQREQSESNV